jgi:nicotinic acid mononucleotide adenylyltransferase
LIPLAENTALRVGQIVEIAIPAAPVSATLVRESLTAGRELPGNWLAPGVTQYIKQNQLYGS